MDHSVQMSKVPVMRPFCRSGASSAWAGASTSMPTAWLFSNGAASAEHHDSKSSLFMTQSCHLKVS